MNKDNWAETPPLELGDIFYVKNDDQEMEAWYRIEMADSVDANSNFDFYCRVIKENHKQGNYFCDHYRDKNDNIRDRAITMISREEHPEWYL